MPIVRRVGDRYVVIRELGRGGQSVVYLAYDWKLDRDVALKELQPGADPGFAARLFRELSGAAGLMHANIVSVYECFEAGDTPYVVSEYIRSGSLRGWVGHLTLPQIAGVLEDILAALAHAHTNGIVHRDLKPENVLVTTEGRVKIADFNIANAVFKAQTVGPQPPDMTVGTPTYMAPEQAMAREIGPWSDLYAVGVMSYELLLGSAPFQDESAVEILLRHVNEPPPSPQSINPNLDPKLVAWIERLLEKHPAARPLNASAAWDALEEIIIHVLGPRWRRSALLSPPEPVLLPLSPAPAPAPAVSTSLPLRSRRSKSRRLGRQGDRSSASSCARRP